MPKHPEEFAMAFANARQGNFAAVDKMSDQELTQLAKIIHSDESLLWLCVRHRKWELAYRLILCGADAGFVIQSGKHRGASVFSETAMHLRYAQSHPSLVNHQEIGEIERLLGVTRLLLAARGKTLSATENFDMSMFNSADATNVAQQYEELLQKSAQMFGSNSEPNYLAAMPQPVQFIISRFVDPIWNNLDKRLLGQVHKELNEAQKKDRPSLKY